MKKYAVGFIIFILVALLVQSLFSKHSIAPKWYDQLVEKDPHLKGLELTKWSFNGKFYYHLPAVCCDIPESLYDENGQKFCDLGGGFANQTDPQCEKFKEQGKLIELVVPGNK